MSNLLKKEKGFTLIEVVLVLAIAGLLMVIVLLAVSGAQKARRDTQRKNDLGRIAGQLEQYASNTNGSYPANQGAFNTAMTGNYALGNGNDPLTGSVYTYNGLATPAGTTSAGVQYDLGQNCAGTAVGSRVYAVRIGLEQGGSACRTNE